jgi:hypothetical protein
MWTSEGLRWPSAEIETTRTSSIQLVPSMGKLGFDVDSTDRGFPPGAYHSEGHQDSMGLCLYSRSEAPPGSRIYLCCP